MAGLVRWLDTSQAVVSGVMSPECSHLRCYHCEWLIHHMGEGRLAMKIVTKDRNFLMRVTVVVESSARLLPSCFDTCEGGKAGCQCLQNF